MTVLLMDRAHSAAPNVLVRGWRVGERANVSAVSVSVGC
jgi:hypothetical protein